MKYTSADLDSALATARRTAVADAAPCAVLAMSGGGFVALRVSAEEVEQNLTSATPSECGLRAIVGADGTVRWFGEQPGV